VLEKDLIDIIPPSSSEASGVNMTPSISRHAGAKKSLKSKQSVPNLHREGILNQNETQGSEGGKKPLVNKGFGLNSRQTHDDLKSVRLLGQHQTLRYSNETEMLNKQVDQLNERNEERKGTMGSQESEQ